MPESFAVQGVRRDGTPTDTFATLEGGLAFWKGTPARTFPEDSFKLMSLGPESDFVEQESAQRMEFANDQTAE